MDQIDWKVGLPGVTYWPVPFTFPCEYTGYQLEMYDEDDDAQ